MRPPVPFAAVRPAPAACGAAPSRDGAADRSFPALVAPFRTQRARLAPGRVAEPSRTPATRASAAPRHPPSGRREWRRAGAMTGVLCSRHAAPPCGECGAGRLALGINSLSAASDRGRISLHLPRPWPPITGRPRAVLACRRDIIRLAADLPANRMPVAERSVLHQGMSWQSGCRDPEGSSGNRRHFRRWPPLRHHRAADTAMAGGRSRMPVRAVVFDAYGTLFDVNAAVRRHDAAVGPRAAELSALWRQRHLEYSWTLTLMGRYRPFWELGRAGARHRPGLTGVDPALKPAAARRLPHARRLSGGCRHPGAAAGGRACHRHPVQRHAGHAGGRAGGRPGSPLGSTTCCRSMRCGSTSRARRSMRSPSRRSALRGGRDRLRLLQPLGHCRGGGVRLPPGVGQPLRRAGRI